MAAGRTLTASFPAPTADLAYQIGMLVLRNIREILSGKRSGRWYPMPGNINYEKTSLNKAKNYEVKYIGASRKDDIIGASYQASAPGEPPAPRTGRLRQSFFLTVQPVHGAFSAVIRTNVYYADDLEYGTERLDPRPFFRPAVQKAIPEIQKLFVGYSKSLVAQSMRGIRY